MCLAFLQRPMVELLEFVNPVVWFPLLYHFYYIYYKKTTSWRLIVSAGPYAAGAGKTREDIPDVTRTRTRTLLRVIYLLFRHSEAKSVRMPFITLFVE